MNIECVCGYTYLKVVFESSIIIIIQRDFIKMFGDEAGR